MIARLIVAIFGAERMRHVNDRLVNLAKDEPPSEMDRLLAENATLRQQVQIAHTEALNAAADDVARVREHGLRPDEHYSPYTKGFETWLRNRAAVSIEGGAPDDEVGTR